MGRDRSHLWELGGQMETAFPLTGSLDLNLHLLQNNISTTGLELLKIKGNIITLCVESKALIVSLNVLEKFWYHVLLKQNQSINVSPPVEDAVELHPENQVLDRSRGTNTHGSIQTGQRFRSEDRCSSHVE
ncbi:unnamed protein product [Leuciscus chuanchicus]